MLMRDQMTAGHLNANEQFRQALGSGGWLQLMTGVLCFVVPEMAARLAIELACSCARLKLIVLRVSLAVLGAPERRTGRVS